MRKFITILVAGMVAGALLPVSAGAQAPASGSERSFPSKKPKLEYVAGRVVVGFKKSADVARVAEATGFRTVSRLGIERSQVVSVPEGKTVQSFVAELEARSDVAWAEPDYIVEYREVPNDLRFTDLWGMHNTGQVINGITGTPDADIDAVEAWDVETGDASIIAAVVDDGVDISHPDFAGRIHPDAYDFGDNDTDPSPNPGDFHGTHVAGTMAASGGDAFGVSGVARNVQILPIKIQPSDGFGTLSTVARGLDYAGEKGAHVVNFSLGVSAIPNSWLQAISENPETLYVTAAGNYGYDNDTTPDTCNIWTVNLICVAASDQNDAITDFSQFGAVNVDLSAPGDNVLSSVPHATVLSEADTASEDAWVTGGVNDMWSAEDFPDIGGMGLGEGVGPYQPNTDSWAQLVTPVDLTAVSGCSVDWVMYLDTVPNRASVFVEASTDASVWEPIYRNTGYTLENASASLADYEGQPQVYLRWRFESDGHKNRDQFPGVLMAWNSVRCDDSAGSLKNFDYLGGTSMASPHVAGAAALLFSHDLNATVEQVRWALLNSTDVIASHAAKTATEGRLNINSALAKLAEAPDDPYVDEVTDHDIKVAFDAYKFEGRRSDKIFFEGVVSPVDGHWACSLKAPVLFQRKSRLNGWEQVQSTFADAAGYYFKRAEFRKGTYRAIVPEGNYNELIYCNEGISDKVRLR